VCFSCGVWFLVAIPCRQGVVVCNTRCVAELRSQLDKEGEHCEPRLTHRSAKWLSIRHPYINLIATAKYNHVFGSA